MVIATSTASVLTSTPCLFERVEEHYDVGDVLGTGSFSTVRKGEHKHHGGKVRMNDNDDDE